MADGRWHTPCSLVYLHSLPPFCTTNAVGMGPKRQTASKPVVVTPQGVAACVAHDTGSRSQVMRSPVPHLVGLTLTYEGGGEA